MTNEKLEAENRVVLALVQALLGSISMRMLAISLSVNQLNESIKVYFAMSDQTDEDRELIEDILTDLSSLAGTHIPITHHVWMGSSPSDSWPGREHRMVYATSSKRPVPED